MIVTHQQLRRIIRESVGRILVEEEKKKSKIKQVLSIVGDLFGFQPVPKLAGALNKLLHRSGGKDFKTISDEELRAELDDQDEFNEDTISKVIELKNDDTLDNKLVRWWVKSGILSPWG